VVVPVTGIGTGPARQAIRKNWVTGRPSAAADLPAAPRAGYRGWGPPW